MLGLVQYALTVADDMVLLSISKKVREKSGECQSHKPQPIPDTKGKQAQIEQTHEKHQD